MTRLSATAHLWMPGHPEQTTLALAVDAPDLLPAEADALRQAAAERWIRQHTSDLPPALAGPTGLAAGDPDLAAIAGSHGVAPQRLADLLSRTTATTSDANEPPAAYPPLRLVRGSAPQGDR